MTFTEAALEVLRSAGKPLHYKIITELAIERNLLSHIGKSPEVTMSSRLATMVKKDRGDAPIVKVKPGVFAARDLGPTPKAAVASTASAQGPASAAAIEDNSMTDKTEEEGAAAPQTVTPPAPPKVALPGGDVFPEEDDDNDPILAGLEEEDQSSDERGRRRRRRRRRGGKGDGPEAGVEGGSEATGVAPPRERPNQADRPARNDRPEPRGDRDRNGGDAARERNDRGPRGDRDRGPRDRDRAPMQSQGRRDGARDAGPPLDWSRQPADGDLLGKDLADATWTVLSGGERLSVTFERAAEMLVRRGRLSGNPAGLAPTIAAAVRADNSRSELADVRPRFRIRMGRLSLTDWALPREVVQAEETVIRSADRQRDQVRRTLIRKLSDLPAAGFAEIVATWLNAEGVVSLRAIRRPSSSNAEFHFAGTLKRGAEETRLAFVVRRDGRDIEREQLVDVRGSLHHYGNATTAWLVTTGRISSGAREEMGVTAAAPCAVFDGMTLAQAMENLGIGLQQHVVRVTSIDMDLFEALGDTSEARMDRDNAEPREPRGPRDGGERAPRGRRGQQAESSDGAAADGGSDAEGVASGDQSDDDNRNTDARELAGAPDSESQGDDRPTPIPGESHASASESDDEQDVDLGSDADADADADDSDADG